MKRFFTVYNAFFITIILTGTANAYIDPSVTSYVIQAVAGIAIAVGAAFGIFWRRAKRKAKETLGIDLEGKKETEEDVVIYSEPSQSTDKRDD